MLTSRMTPSSAHLVGVCGAGMKAMAELLLDRKWRLSGSDLSNPTLAIQQLVERGFTFHRGHDASHVSPEVKCLIHSSAIAVENAERRIAADRSIPQFTYSQMVGELMKGQRGICIAGTHGKSTTTALTAWVLTTAGRDPSVLIGAELAAPHVTSEGLSKTVADRFEVQRAIQLANDHRSGWSDREVHQNKASSDQQKLFVVESCEFQKSFLDYSPHLGLILNIEPDHFDCFADSLQLEETFVEFSQRVSTNGLLLISGDRENYCRDTSIDRLRQCRSAATVTTFGHSNDCDWQSVIVDRSSNGTTFQVNRSNRSWGTFSLPLPGEHNVSNSLAVVAICGELGVSIDEIQRGLDTFPGIRRRFEMVTTWGAKPVISDYAHHPTAIRATLRMTRQVYGDRRIWAIFQPHQVSRTKSLMDDFSKCFESADEVIIVPVYAARETVVNEPIECAEELVRRIAKTGGRARFVESLDRIAPTVEDSAHDDDVVVVMGAGDIERCFEPK